MASVWTREVIVQAGRCPRLIYRFPFGAAYVEKHDAACRRETGAPKGWTLLCRELSLDVHLASKDEDDAKAEAVELLALALEGLALGVRGYGE